MSNSNRIPPHSLDAERAVLGGMLLQNKAIDLVVEHLHADDMYSEANARLYEAMLALHRKNFPVDTVTLREELVRSGRLGSIGGDEYLLRLTDTIPTLENTEAYAKIIKEKAQVRGLISACLSVAAKGYEDYGSAREFIDAAERAIFEASSAQTRSSLERVSSIQETYFKDMQSGTSCGVSGLSWGFSELDTMTDGMGPGHLIVVAGRPGMGKTAFAMNVAVNACRSRIGTSRPATVAVFSLEMPKMELYNRMLGSEARLCARRIKKMQVQRDEWSRVVAAAEEFNRLPIYIDETPGISVMELRAKARRLISQQGLALIVVDYLQLMRSGVQADNRAHEIGEISRALKELAKDLSVPVVALSQLNRSVESRANKDKRPQMSDLRESGAIEQDADVIAFVYRDEVYHPDTQDQGIAEILVRKQRSGPLGTVKLRFFDEYTRFDNLAREAAESFAAE